MSELSIEEFKDHARSQESRIEELQQKKIREDSPETVIRSGLPPSVAVWPRRVNEFCASVNTTLPSCSIAFLILLRRLV